MYYYWLNSTNVQLLLELFEKTDSPKTTIQYKYNVFAYSCDVLNPLFFHNHSNNNQKSGQLRKGVFFVDSTFFSLIIKYWKQLQQTSHHYITQSLLQGTAYKGQLRQLVEFWKKLRDRLVFFPKIKGQDTIY